MGSLVSVAEVGRGLIVTEVKIGISERNMILQ